MVCGVRGAGCGVRDAGRGMLVSWPTQYNATKREKDIFVSRNRDNVSKTKV